MASVLHGCQSGWKDNSWPGSIIVDGSNYTLDVSGINQALVDMNSVGGGFVYIPANANIPIESVSVSIPNRCALIGLGSQVPSPSTFVCSARTNVSTVIKNTTQDGTQQMAGLANININGNKSSGALVTAGIVFASLYSGTFIRDVRVFDCSGIGVQLSGANAASGPYYVRGLTVAGSGNDNILVSHSFTNLRMADVDSESPGTGKACIRLQSDPSSAGKVIFGALLEDIYVENSVVDNTSYGIVLDGTQSCTIKNFGARSTAAGNYGALLRIQKTGTTSPISNRVENIWTNGAQTPLIDDNYAGVTITNAQSSNVSFYESPLVGSDAPGYVFGMQVARTGPNQSSASTLTLSRAANYFVVTGSTQINNITTSPADSGRQIILTFSGTPIVATGGNLKLNSQFTAASNSVLQLTSDGTNWWGGRLS